MSKRLVRTGLVVGAVGLMAAIISMTLVQIPYGLPDPEYSSYAEAHPLRGMMLKTLLWCSVGLVLVSAVAWVIRFATNRGH